jgi:hypothetical protein
MFFSIRFCKLSSGQCRAGHQCRRVRASSASPRHRSPVVLASEEPHSRDSTEHISRPHDKRRREYIDEEGRGDKPVEFGEDGSVLQKGVTVYEPSQHDGNGVADAYLLHLILRELLGNR